MPMLIEARGVSRRFGPVEALSGVTFALPPGAIGLIGPNGAGKTTLLRILLGLIAPDAGEARVFDRNASTDGLPIRERVGYMPEHDCLDPHMTGIGFVAYMGQVSGLPKEAAFQRAHEILQFVGLRGERYRSIGEYSVGMRQRVKLAQALVHDPPLVILDEPTAGLDPSGRSEMLGLLKILAGRAGRSMVLSTHLLGDIESVCDLALMLNAGKVLAAGRVDELRSTGRDELVVRVKGDVAALARALAERGLAPAVDGLEVRVLRPPEGSRPIFEAARAVGVQVRGLGPSVHSVEELFLRRVSAPEGAGPVP